MTALRNLSSSLAAASILALGACTSPGELDPGAGRPGADGPPVPVAPRPWTPAFRSAALIVADVVHIEGPRGLLDHVATRAEDGFHVYEAETVPEGFRQRFEVSRPSAGVELRAWLDNNEIVVLRELVVLERPGDVDVLLRATGDAYWRDLSSGAERRGPELRFTGAIEDPGTEESASPGELTSEARKP
jgi:hypothetical protein